MKRINDHQYLNASPFDDDDDEHRFDDLLALFNLPDKSAVEKHCRTATIQQRDFVRLIEISMRGGTAPYRYASHFHDRLMPHLIPTDAQRAAISTNGIGPLCGPALKAINKMSQQLKERQHFCAHLFYTMNNAHWSLFLFDQRDIAERGNHWEHGPHLHFSSSTWINASAAQVWQQVTTGGKRPPSLHIRYQMRKMVPLNKLPPSDTPANHADDFLLL